MIKKIKRLKQFLLFHISQYEYDVTARFKKTTFIKAFFRWRFSGVYMYFCGKRLFYMPHREYYKFGTYLSILKDEMIIKKHDYEYYLSRTIKQIKEEVV